MVSVVQGGQPVDPRDGQVIFDRNKITFKGGGGMTTGTYKLNPKGKPKSIDVRMDEDENVPGAEEPHPGIHELDGDKLKFCVDQVRPTAFVSKSESCVLMALERVKK